MRMQLASTTERGDRGGGGGLGGGKGTAEGRGNEEIDRRGS